jgi:hypothetical protein
MRKTTIRGTFFIGMLFFALGCFMLFNYMSTLQTLQHILGKEFLVYAFAFALSIVDFAGLARIFTPETSMKDESKLVYFLGTVWILACLLDVAMTAYWVSLRMVESPTSMDVQNLMGIGMYKSIPWIIALGELAMRVSLVLMVGVFGDQFLHGFGSIIPSMQGVANRIGAATISKPSMPARPPQALKPSIPTYRSIGNPARVENDYHEISVGSRR